MKHRTLPVYVAIISSKRTRNVLRMSELVGEATWYVGDGQSQAYENAGAPRVKESGGLCESRNAALRDAWAKGLPCLQLSDDLKDIKMVVPGQAKPVAASVQDVVGLMLETMKLDQYKNFNLAGVAPTANLFYFNEKQPIPTTRFVVGDFILVKPCNLFFDQTLKLREDYDYTLAHLWEFGGVIRLDTVLAVFEHRTNAGGAVAVRTDELNDATNAYLKSKWPAFISDNPRRPGEVLMKWKPLTARADHAAATASATTSVTA